MIAHFGTKKIEFRIKNNTSLRKYCFYPLLLLLAISFVSCSSSNTSEASPASASLPESEEAPAVVAASVPIETQDYLVTAAPSPHPVPMSYKKYPMPEVKTSSEPSKNTKPLSGVSDTAPGKTDNGLRLGKVAWNKLGPIPVKTMAKIEVRLTLDPERFAGLAHRMMKSHGTIEIETNESNFSDDLTAMLVAPKELIGITPEEPQHQNVLKGRDAQWTWSIFPKEAGTHELILTIKSHIGGNVTSESYSHPIFVKALPPPTLWEKIINFLRADWEKFLTLVLIPIGGWLYSIYIKRRKSRR